MPKNILILLLLVLTSCDFLRTGSNPYSENYLFQFPYDTLISKINKFKEANPNYKVLQYNDKGVLYDIDSYSEIRVGDSNITYEEYNENVDWFNAYFYLDEIEGTVLCSINLSKVSRDFQNSTLKLISITYSKNFASWKTINTEDLSEEENKKIKALFEKKVVDHLGDWHKR